MLLVVMFSLALVSAESCDLNVTLLNQDPYPAVPGDYVKLVFQVENVDSSECDDITFTLPADYPIEFNPGESGTRVFEKVDYVRDYESNLLIPYEVRINEDALDGSNPIDVAVQSKGSASITKTFDIEVDDVRADFEIYVKDYDYATRELTLEILNIAEADVEALTLEIPKQDAVVVKGASKTIVGDLDSNEYTTADFEASPAQGEFNIKLTYSDTINTRRTVEKTVSFDSSYFTGRAADQKTTSKTTYAVWAVIAILIVWWIVRKIRKKKKR